MANLVEVLTIQEQLTGDYITPETSITQPEQTTEDIPEETTESFETTPPPAPQESESDDPFADYAEEILDGAGDVEVLDISGTEEEEENTTNQEISSSPESISINEISLNTPIPSSQYSGKSTIVHTPLSVTDIKALRDWKNGNPNQISSSTPLDVQAKIVETFLENAERQWDIDYIAKEFEE